MLIALFYIHIHVRPLPGWCVVKKRRSACFPHSAPDLLAVIALLVSWRIEKTETERKKLTLTLISFAIRA